MKKIILLFVALLCSTFGYSQFSEGFESTTGTQTLPPNPTIWTLGSGNWAVFDNTVGTGVRWDINNALPHQGVNAGYCSRENIGSGNTSEDFLATPSVTVPTNGQLKFWTRQFVATDFGTQYEIRIKPVSAGAQNDPTGYAIIQSWTEGTLNTVAYNQYEEKVVDIPVTYSAGTNVYIAFVMIFTQPGTSPSGDRWLIDDVKVVENCLIPTTLGANTISHNAANLTWTAPSGATAFQVVNSLQGAYTAATVATAPITASTTTASLSMVAGSLTPSTNYEFWVRNNCGSGNFSAWAGPFQYATVALGFNCLAAIQVPNTLPYNTTDNTSNYGDVYDVAQNSACGGGATNFMTGNDVWYSYTPTTSGNISITLTPTSVNSSIFVYAGCPTPNQACLAGVANNTSAIRSIPFLPVTAGTTYVIVISSNRTNTATQTVPYTLVIQKVSCQQPTALTVGTISAFDANLTWDTGIATSWQVAVLPAGPPTLPTGPGTTTTINTNYPATSLTPSTSYQYWVRADCNDGTFSAWAGPFPFTTLPTCNAPTTLTALSITQSTALVGWTQPANYNSSVASSWQIQILPQGSTPPTAASTGWTTITNVTNPYYFTGLTPATCYDYYVRAYCSPTDQSTIIGPKGFCTLIPNDDCMGSIPVPVNQNTNCLQTVQGSLNLATASTQANSCDAANDDDDVWFHFTATATSHYVSLFGINYTPTPTGLKYAIYTGTCPALTQFGTNCVANAQQSNPTLTGLTVGQTYYVRVYSAGTTPVTKIFELCIGTNVGNCSTAIPLCAITPIVIPNNVGVATLPNPISPYSTTSTTVGCLGSAPSPTFYYLQIPQDGNYNFFLEQNTSSAFNGTGIDVDFAAWGPYASNAAACAGISTANASPTGNFCSFSGAFTENFTVNGALAGQIYVVMITNYSGRKGFVRITQTTGPLPTVCCPFGNFTYSSSFYCKDGANPSPIFVSNATAGTFSYTGVGFLDINPTTGLINLANSNTGTYQIHNSITANGQCPSDDDIWTITISAPPSATTISYSSTSYCRSDATSYPVTQTGTMGGNYTVAPAIGLGINPSTGAITPNASTAAGTYIVTYNLPPKGGCPGATSSTTVTITDTPTAGILSGTQTVCLPGTTQFSTTGTGGVWSSSNTAVATVSSTGLVTGVTSGTVTITYNAIGTGGCSDSSSTRTVTFVQPVTAGPLSGNQLLCLPLPQTTLFTSAGTAGGTWTSLNPTIATVNATTGLVTAVATGTATIRYTVSGTTPCPNSVATRTVTISAAATAGTLSGTMGVCVGNTTTFASTISGGAWTSSNTAIATVDSSTGVVTGVSAGTSTITYTITGTGSCGNATATRVVTVSLPPNAGVVSGIQQICFPGDSQFIIIGATGGTWSSSNTAVATVSSTGLVTGRGVGTVTISYFKFGTGGCPSATATRTVTVTLTPTAGILSGNQSICAAGTTTFASTNTTGTWSSGDTAIATVDTTTGDVTGVSAGTATITYTVPASGTCPSVTGTRTVTVTAPANTGTLSGNQSICVHGTTRFASPNTTGAWSSGDTAIATVDATTGYITGVSAGIATITYTVSGTGGCPNATATRTVTIIPPFAITIEGACQGSPFILNVMPTTGAFATGTTFSWSGPGGFSSNSQTPTAPQTGTYTVTVTDINGCQSSGNILVDNISCVIQKGISPNGDGKNDTFDLTGYNVKTLSIYNRYGRKEYSFNNYTNEWSGQSDGGGELPDGAYYYQIDRTDADSLTGWIYINRENK